MRPRHLFWQLLLPILLMVTGVLLTVTWNASRTQRAFWLEQTAHVLDTRARIAIPYFREALNTGDKNRVDRLCKELGAESGTRFTFVAADGEVWGDSYESPAGMENHADRPEVREALKGNIGHATRYSHTAKETFMYVAAPLYDGDVVKAAVRTSLPVTFVEDALAKIRMEMAVAGFVIALAALAAGYVFSKRLSEPLVALRDGAERFARGELDHKLAVPRSHEIGALAEAMNQMAVQLNERLNTVVRQRNEREAILSSMVEGVIAVNREGAVISMNRAAARLLRVDPKRVEGRPIEELVRNTELQAFVSELLEGRTPLERLVMLHDERECSLQAHGAVLRGAGDKAIGAVVVLNDITKMRRLEDIRREFVANVSHELRTPITAIKGFVETLADGALDDRQEAERFLGIIARHADRLNAIVEDLLGLSRLEQQEEQDSVALVEGDVVEPVNAAIQSCEVLATSKDIRVARGPEGRVICRIEPMLIEQAVVNLVDNAIKYSDPGTTITVEVRDEGGEVAISVSDRGRGIAAEHLPRIFERFYRVDKARSRKLGGTGLGLSIVKHIAQVHGGRVSVESAPGKGSTFTIHLPGRQTNATQSEN